ncbi:MAG: hypothetical protein ACLFVD_00285 [Dehalococcoidia bacterium]
MQKWMYAVIAIAIVVGVVGMVMMVRLLTQERPPVENGMPPQNGNAVNGVPDNGENGVPDVATATSLRFKMELTNGEMGEFTWTARNIGTDGFQLKIEGTLYGYDIGYIVNGELEQIWQLEGGEWIAKDRGDEDWDEVWDGFVSELDVVRNELYQWTGGNCTYVDPNEGYKVRIYDIEVNPDLSGERFES